MHECLSITEARKWLLLKQVDILLLELRHLSYFDNENEYLQIDHLIHKVQCVMTKSRPREINLMDESPLIIFDDDRVANLDSKAEMELEKLETLDRTVDSLLCQAEQKLHAAVDAVEVSAAPSLASDDRTNTLNTVGSRKDEEQSISVNPQSTPDMKSDPVFWHRMKTMDVRAMSYCTNCRSSVQNQEDAGTANIQSTHPSTDGGYCSIVEDTLDITSPSTNGMNGSIATDPQEPPGPYSAVGNAKTSEKEAEALLDLPADASREELNAQFAAPQLFNSQVPLSRPASTCTHVTSSTVPIGELGYQTSKSELELQSSEEQSTKVAVDNSVHIPLSGLQNVKPEGTYSGLPKGITEEQLELARQMREDFRSGSKIPKRLRNAHDHSETLYDEYGSVDHSMDDSDRPSVRYYGPTSPKLPPAIAFVRLPHTEYPPGHNEIVRKDSLHSRDGRGSVNPVETSPCVQPSNSFDSHEVPGSPSPMSASSHPPERSQIGIVSSRVPVAISEVSKPLKRTIGPRSWWSARIAVRNGAEMHLQTEIEDKIMIIKTVSPTCYYAFNYRTELKGQVKDNVLGRFLRTEELESFLDITQPYRKLDNEGPEQKRIKPKPRKAPHHLDDVEEINAAKWREPVPEAALPPSTSWLVSSSTPPSTQRAKTPHAAMAFAVDSPASNTRSDHHVDLMSGEILMSKDQYNLLIDEVAASRISQDDSHPTVEGLCGETSSRPGSRQRKMREDERLAGYHRRHDGSSVGAP